MAEDAKWYVVHTYSGYENKVAATIQKTVENRHLEELILDVRVPLETVTELRDTGAKEVERKMFPGYVLIKMHMTDDSWYVVRNTRGVTSFVGPGSKPVALTEQEVAALGMETVKSSLYKVGGQRQDPQRPAGGLWSAWVDSIDKTSQMVKVTVSMFGRETPVE